MAEAFDGSVFVQKPKRKIIANKYLKIATLARGNFCSVKKCRKIVWENEEKESLENQEEEKKDKKKEEKNKGRIAEFYAIKVYNKRALMSQKQFVTDPVTNRIKIKTQLDEVKREMDIFKKIDNERCVKCYEIIDSSSNNNTMNIIDNQSTKVHNMRVSTEGDYGSYLGGKEDGEKIVCTDISKKNDYDDKLYIVMDWMELGSLMNYVEGVYSYLIPSDEFLQENLVKCIARDVALGLQYLHGTGLAHRDIKPQNILMDAEGRIKIGDFGVAEYMNPKYRVTSTKGTYVFMSPESLEIPTEDKPYEGHDGRAADVWALGVTLWVLLFRSVPFTAANAYQLFHKIINEEITFPETKNQISDEARCILKKLLDKDAQRRITITQFLEEPWVRSADYSVAQEYAKRALLYKKEKEKETTEDHQE